MKQDEKEKALDLVLANIEKEYGKGTVCIGEYSLPDIEFISTGCISLDKAMGGGFAKGRIAEIYGPESSGKTTVALHAIAQAQSVGETCAFIDAEHALDLTYAKALGVDTDKLLITQPDCAEDCLNITDKLISSGALGLVIVDSVAALVPRAELDGEVGDSHMGLQARLMGQTLRKITGKTKETNTALIFINQLRMKIGVMYGSPETTAGGNALKFYASQRLDIRVTGKEKIEDEITGNSCRIKVVKNKIAPPFREAEFTLEYGRGINKYVDLLRVSVLKGLVEKSGAWYSYKGERVGQGEANSMEFLKNHPSIFAELYELCK